MVHGATARGQGVPNRPGGGGRWAENAKKMLFRGNEPKILMKIKNLAFSRPQNELLFECKNPQSKQRNGQEYTSGCRAPDCHAVILSGANPPRRVRSAALRRKSRHSRESGNPARSVDVDPRLRGGEEGLTLISMGGRRAHGHSE